MQRLELRTRPIGHNLRRLQQAATSVAKPTETALGTRDVDHWRMKQMTAAPSQSQVPITRRDQTPGTNITPRGALHTIRRAST